MEIKISNLPKLNNIQGEVLIPIIKKQNDGEYVNFNTTPQAIISAGMNTIHNLIKNYLSVNGIGNQQQLLNLITNIDFVDSDTVKTLLNDYLQDYSKTDDLNNAINLILSKYLKDSDLDTIRTLILNLLALAKDKTININDAVKKAFEDSSIELTIKDYIEKWLKKLNFVTVDLAYTIGANLIGNSGGLEGDNPSNPDTPPVDVPDIPEDSKDSADVTSSEYAKSLIGKIYGVTEDNYEYIILPGEKGDVHEFIDYTRTKRGNFVTLYNLGANSATELGDHFFLFSKENYGSKVRWVNPEEYNDINKISKALYTTHPAIIPDTEGYIIFPGKNSTIAYKYIIYWNQLSSTPFVAPYNLYFKDSEDYNGVFKFLYFKDGVPYYEEITNEQFKKETDPAYVINPNWEGNTYNLYEMNELVTFNGVKGYASNNVFLPTSQNVYWNLYKAKLFREGLGAGYIDDAGITSQLASQAALMLNESTFIRPSWEGEVDVKPSMPLLKNLKCVRFRFRDLEYYEHLGINIDPNKSVMGIPNFTDTRGPITIEVSNLKGLRVYPKTMWSSGIDFTPTGTIRIKGAYIIETFMDSGVPHTNNFYPSGKYKNVGYREVVKDRWHSMLERANNPITNDTTPYGNRITDCLQGHAPVNVTDITFTSESNSQITEIIVWYLEKPNTEEAATLYYGNSKIKATSKSPIKLEYNELHYYNYFDGGETHNPCHWITLIKGEIVTLKAPDIDKDFLYWRVNGVDRKDLTNPIVSIALTEYLNYIVPVYSEKERTSVTIKFSYEDVDGRTIYSLIYDPNLSNYTFTGSNMELKSSDIIGTVICKDVNTGKIYKDGEKAPIGTVLEITCKVNDPTTYKCLGFDTPGGSLDSYYDENEGTVYFEDKNKVYYTISTSFNKYFVPKFKKLK